MTLPSGTVEYTLGTAPARLSLTDKQSSGGQVTGCGISRTAEELDTALAGPVAGVVVCQVNGGSLCLE